MVDPSYVMSHFSLAVLKILFVFIFIFQKFDNNVSQCASSVALTWSWLNFLDVYIHLSRQAWDVFSIISSYILLLFPFCDAPNVYVLNLMVRHVCQALFTFLQSFYFLFLKLHIYCHISSRSLTLPFTCSNLPLTPSNEFFISVIVACSSRISFWFLFWFFSLIVISTLFVRHFLDFIHVFFWFFEHC